MEEFLLSDGILGMKICTNLIDYIVASLLLLNHDFLNVLLEFSQYLASMGSLKVVFFSYAKTTLIMSMRKMRCIINDDIIIYT